MPRVAFVSLEVPFPTTSGKRNVLAGFLGYLSERVGNAQLHYVKLGKSSPEDKLVTDRFPGLHFHTIAPAARWKALLAVASSSLLTRERSIQEALVFSPACERKLRDYVAANGIDVVVCDTVRVGQFFVKRSDARARRVLYYEDLFSERYEKMLSSKITTDEGKLVLGAFAGKIPSFMRRLVEAPAIRTLILRTERDLLRRREVQQAKAFDAAGLLNPDEGQLLAERCGDAVEVTTLPIRMPHSSTAADRNYTGSRKFIFLGKLDYLPNAVSLRAFVETCGEALAHTLPRAQVDIIGSGDSIAIRAVVDKFPDTFRLVGYVEDLQEALASCAALIVPMTVGSGVKLKTLEAIAAGIPVISTPIGAEGIAIEHGVSGLIAQRLEEFPALMKICLDPQANRRLSKGACELFASHFSHDVIDEIYDRFFFGQIGSQMSSLESS